MAAEAGGDALSKTVGDTISLEQGLTQLTHLAAGETREVLNALMGLFDGQPTSQLGFATFMGFALGTAGRSADSCS